MLDQSRIRKDLLRENEKLKEQMMRLQADIDANDRLIKKYFSADEGKRQRNRSLSTREMLIQIVNEASGGMSSRRIYDKYVEGGGVAALQSVQAQLSRIVGEGADSPILRAHHDYYMSNK